MSANKEKSIFERLFKLEENQTNVKTEILAGITTFITMSYIIFVNPAILSETGMPYNGVFIATIVSSILGTLSMAFLTNYPFALAPGMGLNAFFAYSVVIGMGVSWKTALGLVFIEGIIFIILSLTPIRKTLVNSIPMSLKTAISAGIGLFIAFIGLQNAKIVVADPSTLVTMGQLFSGPSLIAILGLIITAILFSLKIKGALLLGIIISTILGLFNGVTPIPEGIIALPKMSDWSTVLFKLDLHSAFSFEMIGVMISFLFVDIFDTAGTLIGVSQQAGYLKEDGTLPKADKAMLADAIATTGGALFGTSTVTTYVESASGVSAGGRTGLTGVVVSILFFLSLFFRPIIATVPSAATAPALIIVGVMMLSNILKIQWDDFTEVIPAFIAMITMPLTYSVSNGIALGFITYPILKLFTGKGKEVHWMVYLLCVLFILYFIWL
ncbi:MAG: NCS2 family permease [Defluviitoga tunisiensis]|jgi:AGZA family xanthine/uracil permease-like MFS transporter|uniref:Xanthine/uracil/vitamin C permease n=1 Tax=Defluviitoga tunisiensis TaxID=1006576 RepID=A0A0C7NLF9_DEFTU|nr:NCS2 family permease [Defluviitoga tunisiensis]MDD3600185.1 NCS2 family permease [Defluviitoga tunisiensis]MDY0379640.1 NCS2 family permease [Defluviitoga tunisiensis]CEP78731.1 Xanthine/uracil/vitamin C permease [Defluviitoga tunisiensis]HHV01955.1 NCS2 family permease [Defluviitoga tunisiensis]HOB54659.1 NCS2 family permease [Defluviitoga tunisiensis]